MRRALISLDSVRVLHLDGAGAVSLVPVPLRPAATDAVVRVEASALCGSERGAFHNGFAGNVGHEAVGRLDVAPAGFEVGERVGLSAVASCGQCDACRGGEETSCSVDLRMVLGMHSDAIALPASALRRLPQGLDPVTAVLLCGDTIGVAARAARRVPHTGPVLVIGLGPVGLGHVLVRSRLGSDVVGIDPEPTRRELALALGASRVAAPGEIVEHFPMVVEATGNPGCVSEAFDRVERGGVVVQSGECSRVELNPSRQLVRREINYVGTWYFSSVDLEYGASLLVGDPALHALATDVVAACDAQSAVDAFLKGTCGKVVIDWRR